MTWLARWRAWISPRATGPAGERAAVKHLKKQGYRILAKNLRNRFGEVDVLALAPDGCTVVIVEVKSRAVRGAGDGPRPEVRVNHTKQRKLSMLAGQLVRRYRMADRAVRFDVIGIDLHEGGEAEVRHHEGAFESLL